MIAEKIPEDPLNTDNVVENKSNIINLDDEIIREIELDKNIRIRIVETNDGRFIDIRKFYKGFPTKKYIKISFKKFRRFMDVIKDFK